MLNLKKSPLQQPATFIRTAWLRPVSMVCPRLDDREFGFKFPGIEKRLTSSRNNGVYGETDCPPFE